MTNQETIEIFKAHMESARMTADFCKETGRGDASYFEKNIEAYKLAIAALERYEAEKIQKGDHIAALKPGN
ncbi:MAG: hypothetical protein LUE92_10225 [Clostridiales bacterium]|nr:hypothetical protein [Clostridiales bacterium]